MVNNNLQIFVLILVIALPIAWLASEFQNSRGLRIVLGLAAILASFGVAFVVGNLQNFNANAWYGNASKNLIDVTIEELEAENKDQVVRELKKLQEKFRPTYENRARYDKLIEEFMSDLGHEPKNSV